MVGNIRKFCVNCGSEYSQHSLNQIETCVEFMSIALEELGKVLEKK